MVLVVIDMGQAWLCPECGSLIQSGGRFKVCPKCQGVFEASVDDAGISLVPVKKDNSILSKSKIEMAVL